MKASSIMKLDDILLDLTNFRPNGVAPFGSTHYWLAFFGNPESDPAWGWQLDGHHLAMNFTVVNDELIVTPSFMGTDPAEVRSGPHTGWRILGEEDDKGLAFVNSLVPDQQKDAILGAEAPQDIFTGPGRGDALKSFEGLSASTLNATQQKELMYLIDEYIGNYSDEARDQLYQAFSIQGMDNLHFAWIGPVKPGPEDKYYYRIHGPALLIEFENAPAPGPGNKEVNHAHSILRLPGNDFGEDLLKKHYETSPHHNF